ncbi:hypothetical protein FOMPIDRAFT_56238 [Fomitopsis schrenkii]|uniref:LYR motif-containing protein Cup1-like N-terminal domain-containing protein n=1 Tax=Fomitopsis schrenkii TaxID=2126942 RepID=S8E8Y2_FOMSC|nr:hypothetical protein FOMPIDRAFT_56238 [Fomitopsis schrenkii]
MFHRQIRLLPTSYLRHFFRLKLSDDARAVLETYDPQRRFTKFKRIQNELDRLRLANRGVWEKFDHVLDLAYGRKGKLRWELLEPILSDPASSPPDRIIPSVERSRPPVFSPELTALLTDSLATKNKALTLPAIQKRPPSLSARADPDSEEARLYGPFSKRREVNLRWRFYSKQLRYIYPPLEVGLEQGPRGSPQRRTVDRSALQAAGIRPMALQGTGLVQEIEHVARTGHPPDTDSKDPELTRSHLRPRFLKRRFARLLERMPQLTYNVALAQSGVPSPDAKQLYRGKADSKRLNSWKGYTVHLSPVSARDSKTRAHDADEVDVAWIQWGSQHADSDKVKKSKKVKATPTGI